MDIKTDQEFVQWIKRAVSTSDDCYIELYNLLLRSHLTIIANLFIICFYHSEFVASSAIS